jgi:outer membrane immunogenic protein
MRPIVAVAALVAFVSSAQAADMSQPFEPGLRGALPSSDGPDFSGTYVGGFGGFSQQLFDARQAGQGILREMLRNTVYLNPGLADDVSTYRVTTTNNMTYGLYIGHNWQVEDYIVGFEADYTRANLNGTSSGGMGRKFCVPDCGTFPHDEYQYVSATSSQLKISDYGTLRARFGMPMGQLMPYATAGLAMARASYGNVGTMNGQVRTVTQSVNPLTGVVTTVYGPFSPQNYSQKNGARTRFAFGYTLGAGLDWAVTSNIILRGEVQHVRFGNVGDTNSTINTARAGAAVKF